MSDRIVPPALVLASSSPYRRALLERLGLPFECRVPDIDETPQAGEDAADLVRRLAWAKAVAVAAARPAAYVVGSDQVAVDAGRILGKPGDHAAAVAQLEAASGRVVRFLTGLCVVAPGGERHCLGVVETRVRFRPLTRAGIERYLAFERPYDCAGSFKVEGLGIVLFEAIEGDDPSALTGLPLIRLVDMLGELGVDVLACLPAHAQAPD